MSFDNLGKTVQVIAVVVGVVMSIISFNNTRNENIQARIIEAQTQRITALAPFYELRQNRYIEISETAAILADKELYTKEELVEANKRFRALYIIELSMVESPQVEASMKELATAISPDLLNFNEAQSAAYNLSHALRNSFTYDK